MKPTNADVELEVIDRYTQAAGERSADLCCPVEYDPKYLDVIPREILERDYGCGDPSRYVREGDRVLDLGSGSGKICYIASQMVGPKGYVIGIDMNPEMLSLARKYRSEIAERLGYANVEFRQGKIQDLSLDLERVEEYLGHSPVTDVDSLLEMQAFQVHLRKNAPMIPDESIDVVVSNCVLNLVRESDRHQLLAEIYRVLRKGGRIAISDIVSDEEIPSHLRQNGELWSGCLSGAFTEHGLLRALEEAGFYGISISKWDKKPWQTLEGIEFRSVTVTGFKGKQGPCVDRNQAVMYKGPWKSVTDDDGHTLYRGERMAVCDKTFGIYTNHNGPYVGDIIGIHPREEIDPENGTAFNCHKSARRSARESKGVEYQKTELSQALSCGPDGCC